MLCDPHVINVADWFRPTLVKGLIVPFRQHASTRHYELIWDKDHKESPLIYQAKKLAENLEALTQMPVEIAMRYGEPGVQLAFERLLAKENRLHEVIVLPLFPQYAESSYKTVVDHVGETFFRRPYPFRLKFTEPYYDHPAYINSLAESIRSYMTDGFDKLVFTFHSLPLDHVEEGWSKGKDFDYVYQTKETIRLLIKVLDIDTRRTRLVYHSAMGNKWLKPGLEETIRDLAKEGRKKIIVVAPGFAADNLETLYDINIRARELFMKAGGETFSYVPCLNHEEYWVKNIVNIIS